MGTDSTVQNTVPPSLIIKIGENTYTQSDIQELGTSICKLENEISECDNTIESKISKEEFDKVDEFIENET